MPDIEARVAVLESKVEDVESEQLRARSRLHDLESDRALLRLLVGQTKELSQKIEEIAEKAAARAVALALAESKRDSMDGRWKLAALIVAILSAIVILLGNPHL